MKKTDVWEALAKRHPEERKEVLLAAAQEAWHWTKRYLWRKEIPDELFLTVVQMAEALLTSAQESGIKRLTEGDIAVDYTAGSPFTVYLPVLQPYRRIKWR